MTVSMRLVHLTLPVLMALAVSSASLGCSTAPAPPVQRALEAARPRKDAPRGRYRLAVAPMETNPTPSTRGAATDGFTPVPADLSELTSALTSAAMTSGAFERVRLIERKEPPSTTRDRSSGAASTASGERDAMAEDAFRAHDDLLLTLRLRKHAVRYAGHNGWFVPNVVNFFSLIWTAWLVADTEYEGEIAIDAEWRAVGSGQLLSSRTYRRSAVSRLDGVDVWNVCANFFVPDGIVGIGELDESRYANIGRHVLPHARNAVAVELAEDLAKLREAEAAPFKPGLSQSLALIVGTGRSRSLPDLRVATDDATEWLKLLTDPALSGMPARNAVLLTEDQPLRARVLADLRERVSRAGPADLLELYFSGYGFEMNGELFIAPFDLDPARPIETAMALSDIARELDGTRARVLVILDTSFSEEGSERTATRTLRRALLPSLGAAAPAAGARVRAALDRFARGRVVVTASQPDQPATELSPKSGDKAGLLTARLLDAARQARGKPLSVDAAFEKAQTAAGDESTKVGFPQVPEMFVGPGVNPATVPLLPRRSGQ